MDRILIIAAHPDDDILGCGGVISKYSRSSSIRVIFLGEGSTCRFDDPTCKEAFRSIEQRKSYAINALSHLKVNNYMFYDFPCGKFDQVPLLDINKTIENEIISFNPDTIFTHSDCDSNQDHTKVYNSTIIATRPPAGVQRVYCYEVLSSTEWGFTKAFLANSFIPLTEKNVLDKWEALSQYKSEINNFPHPRSKDGIITLAKYRGLQSGSHFAEGFKLVRDFSL